MESHFTEENLEMSNKYVKRWSISLVVKEMLLEYMPWRGESITDGTGHGGSFWGAGVLRLVICEILSYSMLMTYKLLHVYYTSHKIIVKCQITNHIVRNLQSKVQEKTRFWTWCLGQLLSRGHLLVWEKSAYAELHFQQPHRAERGPPKVLCLGKNSSV